MLLSFIGVTSCINQKVTMTKDLINSQKAAVPALGANVHNQILAPYQWPLYWQSIHQRTHCALETSVRRSQCTGHYVHGLPQVGCACRFYRVTQAILLNTGTVLWLHFSHEAAIIQFTVTTSLLNYYYELLPRLSEEQATWGPNYEYYAWLYMSMRRDSESLE